MESMTVNSLTILLSLNENREEHIMLLFNVSGSIADGLIPILQGC